jgi:hypothetical protein
MELKNEGKVKQILSFLVRNPYTYCFRMNVPKDLQSRIGKKDLRYSLRTGYLGIAKHKLQIFRVRYCESLFMVFLGLA